MSIEFDGKRFWFRSGVGGQQQPVPEAAERDLLTLITLFRLQFGRDPEPGDPLLFAPRKTTTEYLERLDVHPAYRAAYAQLGFLITTENVRFAQPEDVVRWAKAITEWSFAHPEAPPVPSQLIGAVKPRGRAIPESAAVQEALALADRAATEDDKLVVPYFAAAGATRRSAASTSSHCSTPIS
jgi:hypothetical protein